MAMTIGASRFKERCLALLDGLPPEGIVITKHGRPVARLLPVQTEHAELIGRFRDAIRIRGDVLSSGRTWDAES